MKLLTILRGLPGSGKSTIALRHLTVGTVILSTDDIISANGNYLWSGEIMASAHKTNQLKALNAAKKGIPHIIIDNTNTTYKECEPYIKIAQENGYTIEILEPTTEWAKNPEECAKRNTHNVPLDSIKKMLARWESTTSILDKILN